MIANVLYFCVTTWDWNDLCVILHVSRDTIHHSRLIEGKEKIAQNFCFLYFIKKKRLMVTTSNDSIVEDVLLVDDRPRGLAASMLSLEM